MPTHRGEAPRQFAVRVSFVPVVVSIVVGGLAAQTLHPFAPPRANPTFGLVSVTGVVDVNRDGSPDVIVPSPFLGSRVTTFDEEGNALVANGSGPGTSLPPGATMPPGILAMAVGAFDGDRLDDVVAVTTVGSVHFHRNLGSTRPDRAAFAPDVILDSPPPISPFLSCAYPTAVTCDLDVDGHDDVVLAGGPVNLLANQTMPGEVVLLRGLGAGAFQIVRHALGGCVIDLEVADFDGDGHVDHVVVLTETGTGGAFANELVHLTWTNGALVAAGWPQPVGPGRLSCLELADVDGDGQLDYVLGQITTAPSGNTGGVCWFGGDGQGNVIPTTWGLLPMPTNTSGIGDFVASVQAGDWNRDGHVDLAILRGFTQAPAAFSAAPVQYAEAELLVAMGPNVMYAALETIALPGRMTYGSTTTNAFAQLPLMSAPDALRTIDFGGDGSVDLLVPALWTTSSPTQPLMVTLRNTTPAQFGDARYEKVGAPSGGTFDHPARIGFEGGRPVPGNSSFAVTVQNVQGGCVAGLIWGPVGVPNYFVAYGITANLAPLHYGGASLVCGSGPGEGFLSQPLPIPPLPALIGDAGYFQFAYYDHVSGNFGGTQATGLWIGN